MITASSTALPTRPGTDPVFGSFGGLIRNTFRSLGMQWFLYRAERRKSRSTEPVGEMNAHMLRDIGAPDAMIASAAGARPAYQRHGIPFGFSVVLVAIALAVTGTPVSAEIVVPSAARSSGQALTQAASVPMAGVFAGEYVNGAPVYRFPAVVVTGSAREVAAARPQPPCRQSLAHAAKSRA